MCYNKRMPTINLVKPGTPGAYSAYGGCLQFMTCRNHQVFLVGSAGSGKTTSCSVRMTALCLKYPGCKFLFTRKSYRSLLISGVETFEKVVREIYHMSFTNKKPGTGQIQKMGETEPREYRFPYAKRVDENGRVWEGQSRIVLASIDRVKDQLGAEYDYIYVNQPEQIEEEDWGYLTSRANGRHGKAPFPQLFGDPNPEHDAHWIRKGGAYEYEGEEPNKWLLIRSTYRDNPIIWDQENQCFTEEGKQQIGNMRRSMNPTLQIRMIEGDWASYEGLVYGDVWDKRRHLIPRSSFQIDANWQRYWAFDFGMREPFVWVELAKHPQEELYVIHKYIHMTERTINEHAQKVRELTANSPKPVLAVADREPNSIAILSQALGVNVISAKKPSGSVKSGINAVTEMLKSGQLYVMEDSCVEEDWRLRDIKKPIGFEEEIENYRWDPDKPDMPIQEDDHSLDAVRYLVSHIKAGVPIVEFIWL